MIEFITTTNFNDAQRLFHGRGHSYVGLEHINVDWLSPVIFITIYKEVDAKWLVEQAKLLKGLTNECKSVMVQYRYEKFSPTQVLLGEDILDTTVTENGLSYHISFGKAQNSGLFLDMANGRSWVQANSKDKKVLNLFAYTCAFSVAAVAGDASRVVNLDLSKASLSKGRENHRLNGQLSADSTATIRFEGLDIFKSNSRIKKYGQYDLLICDPPSFQKGSVNIEKDYAKIIRRIPQWMKPGAELLLCLNSPDLNDDFLVNEVEKECPDCKFIERIANPEVFKEAHLGKGLKTLLFIYQPS
jgi:23S rRNA (cytosine1962-C5)-methyltransferase